MIMWKGLSIAEALQKLENSNKKPLVEEFIYLLQKCRKSKDLAYAHRLHLCIQNFSERKTYEHLGNHIVPMFIECGSIFYAEEVFWNLLSPNVHAWNSLIVGYVLHERISEAFDLYQKMQENKVYPSGHTLVALVKACIQMHDVRKVHDEVVRKGFETDIFVGSSLIDKYIKYNSLSEALRLFDLLSVRNVVTWNMLIAGYAEQDGFSYEAINCLMQMEMDGICPDDATFVGVLKSSSAMKHIEGGRILHTEILLRGLEREISIGNTLIDMYAKCGYISEAGFIFNKMSMRTTVSWNAMIGAYIEHGFDQEGLNCFDQMDSDGCAHNPVTLVCVLKACTNLNVSHRGKDIHIEMMQKGYEREIVLCSRLVDVYAKNGLMEEAWATSCELPFRDVILWNTLISGYAEQDPGSKMLECMEKMQLEGVSPNNITFANMLKGCFICESLDKCLMPIHIEIIMRGFEEDVFVGSSLVDMYVKHGLLLEAKLIFDRLLSKNIVSWTALISGYAEYGFNQEALQCFYQSECQGISPNSVMFASALKACNNTGCIKQGQNLHTKIIEKGFDNEVLLGNTLIDIYAKCCSLEEAYKVFQRMPTRTVESWNAMIKGYGMNEEGKMAIQLFKEMLDNEVQPNDITYTCILSACSHGSLVSEARAIFEIFNKRYNNIPPLDTYACMVDVLARSGNLHEAEKLLKTVPCSPSLDMWFALFSACKTHEDVNVGYRCFEQLKNMNPKYDAPYFHFRDVYECAQVSQGIT